MHVRSLSSAIITNQDEAMQKDIEIVFPDARNRWCLRHIKKKFSEKLRGYYAYEAIETTMKGAGYDCLTEEEFENTWNNALQLLSFGNEWLRFIGGATSLHFCFC